MEQMSPLAEGRNVEQRIDVLSLQNVPEQLKLAPSELVTSMVGEAEYREIMSDSSVEVTSDEFDEIEASGILQDEAIEFLGEAQLERLKALDVIDSYPVDRLEKKRQELCERFVQLERVGQEEARRWPSALQSIVQREFDIDKFLSPTEDYLESCKELSNDIMSYGAAFDALNTAYGNLVEATATIKMTLALYEQMREFHDKLQARQLKGKADVAQVRQVEDPDILEQAEDPKDDKWQNMMGVV